MHKNLLAFVLAFGLLAAGAIVSQPASAHATTVSSKVLTFQVPPKAIHPNCSALINIAGPTSVSNNHGASWNFTWSCGSWIWNHLVIDWGDGNNFTPSPVGSSGSQWFAHTYHSTGNHTIYVELQDQGSTVAARAWFNVFVNN